MFPYLHGVLGSAAAELWTPTSPTDEGGVLPHTFLAPGVENYQDAAKTTVAGLGDVVGAVVNEGSDTYDVTQGTTASKPVLVQRTINTVTGYYWNHDGADDWLQGAFGGGAISQPYTMFAVIKVDDVPPVQYNIIDSDDSSNRMVLQVTAAEQFRLFFGTLVVANTANTTWNIHSFLASGASSEHWLNGVSGGVVNPGTHTPDGLTFGARFDGAVPVPGDIGPILIYAGNLSNADKNQVGEYLERTTGIAWTEIT